METYETCATVEEHGRVLVAGVPFAPGTTVEVTISPKRQGDNQVTSAPDAALAAARARMQDLFRTVKGFRNSPRIPREDLYERGSLR
jgi:hypothetical protein